MDRTIKAKFEALIIPIVYARGWSYEYREGGLRVVDGLGVAGDHWDGRTIDLFFPYTEEGLEKAKAFCDET